LVFVAVLGLAWFGWMWWARQRDRAALADAKEAIDANRFQAAERKLSALLTSNPDWDEAIYLQGVNEQACGLLDAAAKSWDRIPPGSAFFVPALVSCAELFTDLGRFADAEEIIRRALLETRVAPSPLRSFLVPMYSRQGRALEAMRLIEASWDLLDPSTGAFLEQTMRLLKTHSQLSLVGPPVDDPRVFRESGPVSARR
jgi:tetratricopeptide (TPR) repeat protein